MKIITFLVFVFCSYIFIGCSKEIDPTPKEEHYVIVDQQQKGVEIFSDYLQNDVSRMLLRIWDSTYYELSDIESVEIVKNIFLDSEYLEIEDPQLEGGLF